MEVFEIIGNLLKCVVMHYCAPTMHNYTMDLKQNINKCKKTGKK